MYNISIGGQSSNTVRIPVTDVAQVFADAVVIRNGKVAEAAFITCEDNNVRFSFGVTVPTQGAGATGHMFFANQSLRLGNSRAARTFSFINAVNGSNAVLQVTFEF